MHFSFITPVVCCFCGYERNDLAPGDLTIGNHRSCPQCKKQYVISGMSWGSGGGKTIKTDPPDDFFTDYG